MGDPKKHRKKFETPKKLWNKSRILEEKELSQKYGLKNRRELWRIKATLTKERHNARKMLALPLETREKREKELLEKLYRQGLLEQKATLEDVLSLSVEAFLERRLETIAWRKGLAMTPKQARQFITHGHVSVAGTKVTSPGKMVSREEEGKINWSKKPLKTIPKEQKKESIKKKFDEVKPKDEKTEAPEDEKPSEENKEEKAEKKPTEQKTAEAEKGKKEEAEEK